MSVQADWTAPMVAPSTRRMPYLEYRPELPYHSSAVLAAALDTITLPWRRKRDRLPLYEVTGHLAAHGRTVASVAAALPLELGHSDTLATWLTEGKLQLCGLTPGVADDSEVWSGCAVLRGVDDTSSGASVGDPWSDLMTRAGSQQLTSRLRDPLLTVAPFPALFSPAVDPHGLIRQQPPRAEGVRSVPVAAVLESGRGVGDSLASLLATCARFNVSKFHRFAAAGLEPDDFAEVLERLDDLQRCYRP